MPYFGLASLTDPAPQTLGATSFPCFGKASLPKVAEVAALFKRLQAACDANPNLRLSMNVFDADAHGATIEAGGLRCSPAEEPLPLRRRPQQPDDGRRRELRELQAPTNDERQPAA